MKDQNKVVEMAMEIALTPEIMNNIESKYGILPAIASGMSTSVGGIGPLLRERIISQQEKNVDIAAISLLYEKVWVQRWHFWGQFYLEQIKVGHYIKSLLEETDIKFKINIPGCRKKEISVWKAEFNGAPVYYLNCPDITNIVYPGPEDAPIENKNKTKWAFNQRMYQSWILGRGGLTLLKKLNILPEIIILSETPSIFSIHKLIDDNLGDEKVFENVKYVFNDHTPLEYAHPVWPQKILEQYKFKKKYYDNLSSYKKDNNKIDITQLIVDISDSVYGVSEIHGNVMRNMPTLKSYSGKIDTITNGVSIGYWQAKEFKNHKQMSPEKALETKIKLKEEMIEWMWYRYKFGREWKNEKIERPLIMWMRRVTGYKRLDILKEILERDDLKKRFLDLGIVFFIGGRVHQNDASSDKLIFSMLDIVQGDPVVEQRVHLLDNFNIMEAHNIFKGVDAAVMISNKGREASATGFMKGQMNGTMLLATNDGAIPESVTFYKEGEKNQEANGFWVQYTGSEPTAENFMNALEQFVKVYNDKKLRANMIKNALKQTEKVDITRTVDEMIKLYEKCKVTG